MARKRKIESDHGGPDPPPPGNHPPPLITKEHIEAILYLLNKGEIWQPRSPTKIVIRSTLIPHVEQYRALLGLPLIGMDVDQQPINFLTTSIFTNLKVNIEQHFVQMLFPLHQSSSW